MLHLTTSWASWGLSPGVDEEPSDERPPALGRRRRGARASIPDPREAFNPGDVLVVEAGHDDDEHQQVLVPEPRR